MVLSIGKLEEPTSSETTIADWELFTDYRVGIFNLADGYTVTLTGSGTAIPDPQLDKYDFVGWADDGETTLTFEFSNSEGVVVHTLVVEVGLLPTGTRSTSRGGKIIITS